LEGYIVAGAIVTGLFVLIGAGIAYAVSKPGQSDLVIKTPPSDCNDFCMAWQMSRMDVCAAQAQLAGLVSAYNAASSTANALLAAAAAAAAAAWAFAGVPILNGILAGAAATLATAALIALGIAGSIAGALLQTRGEVAGKINAEELARLAVFDHCEGAALTSCLAMPPPC
jgi:hypothetical protein